MNNTCKILVILLLVLPAYSCRKLINYFREPETEVLAETIQSTVLTAYAANLAMAVMDGQSFSNVTLSRSNPGFPCTTVMLVNPAQSGFSFAADKASAITIAGLWPDESTAILSLLYLNYQSGSNTLDLVGIETIPVMREGDNLHVALAGMDIRFNPDQESILSINLTTLEIESELLRLETPNPTDVYVAVLQKAYYINVNNAGTSHLIEDDSYTVTGGGQLIEVAGSSASIIQQAMVDVRITSGCTENPVEGMALIKTTGLADKGLPELGTAVLQFTSLCSGTAHVYIATGMYAGSNGKNIPFPL